MAIDIPALESGEVDLVVPATLQRPSTEERIRGRLAVSRRPFVTRLTRAGLADVDVDPALLASLPAGDDYFVVAFYCTYRPAADVGAVPFVESRIGVRLSTPGDGPQPVALALAPRTAAAPTDRSFRISVGAPLGFVEPSVEYSRSGSREEQYVTALGRGQSDPEWRLRAVPNHPLLGDVRLAMVVQSPPAAEVTAEIIVAATVRRLGLVRSRAELPPLLHRIDLHTAAEALPAADGGAPGTGAPGTGAPGTGALGTGALGTGALGTGALGTGALGTGALARAEAPPGDLPPVN
ncbi:hypothetical protein OH807_03295 [Kitasatospora sp. NBC_01560]|uniref:hypothetical protein n=1 Tax=Kitasatospora sp. NBC_01560 TaxID=2975965 RepID=UPI00386FC533